MKVIILTSATGGGHNMRARSLSQWAERERPGWQVKIHPVLESSHGLYHFGVELYNVIQKKCPILHHLYFNYLEVAGMFRHGKYILGRDRFVAMLEKERPEVLVSVHGSTNHGFFEIARAVLGREKVRCLTYCAEMDGSYGFSRHWVNPDADLFIGSVPETLEAAAWHGMPKERARVGGFLLHPSFYQLDDPVETAAFWRDTVGLDPARFTVILSTGANSANNHDRFLRALRHLGRPIQVVALCGTSEPTRQRVESMRKSLHDEGVTVRALPKTDKMALLMRRASAIVARPGSGTANEAIQSGCPLIFNRHGALMPQEMITEHYGTTYGLSESINGGRSLTALLRNWIDHPAQPRMIRERMLAIRPRQHPTDILAMIEGARAI